MSLKKILLSLVLLTISAKAAESDFKILDTEKLQAELADDSIKLQILIGNSLFFDTNLSLNRTTSCASCHNPGYGFAENKMLSVGSEGKTLKRHTQSLVNLNWQSKFFWDGRAASLEEQALMPIADKDEMNLPLDELRKRLESNPSYVEAFRAAYAETGITNATIARSIASFEKTLISQNSPFDQYLGGNKSMLNESQIRGMKLFSEKAQCIKCHSGANFHDNEFHNTGVRVSSDEKGRAKVDRVGRKEFDVVPYPFFATKAAFKTPNLRNVALTPPYFHNGSEPNLKEVVKFYNQGGKDPDRAGRAKHIEKLNLTDEEIQDIVAFLESLTAELKVLPITSFEIIKTWKNKREVATEQPKKK